jgi:hypothetical protein
MFSIDISVNKKLLYHIEGENLTPRGMEYAGVCAYKAGIKGNEFTLMHERRDGLLELSRKVLNRLNREVKSGKIDRKQIEEKWITKNAL